MLLTLHRYILRDLLKTFVLCGLALTLLVTMGGGVANLFRGEGLSALDIARLFVLFVPVAATIVLPIAAMFSAAMTYGRLSADNEINACRAAGINIHRLLTSVVFLGLGVSAFTYYAWNFVIPRFIQRAEETTRQDIARVAATRLQKNKSLQYQKMSLHADQVQPLAPDPKRPGRQNLELRGVAFFEIEGSQIAAQGTAEAATVHFDEGESLPAISADLWGVRTYNSLKAQYMEAEHQPLGPYTIPLPLRERLSYLDLPTLERYSRRPASMRDIADQLRVVRHAATTMLTYDMIEQLLTTGDRRATLSGSGTTVELSARVVKRSRKYGDLTLEDVAVVQSPATGESTRQHAVSATVIVRDHPLRRERQFIEVELSDVEQPAAPSDGSGRPTRKSREALPMLDVPAAFTQRVAAMTDDELLDPNVTIRLSDAMTRDREKLIEKVQQKATQVVSLIHFRSAMAVSGVCLVMVAAMLGMVFRGSHVLTAFGVSCLPALVVTIAIMAGRNLAEYPSMSKLGLSIMWGINLALAGVTAVVATRSVKR